MRTKIVSIAAAGVLGASGLALTWPTLAGPALAAAGAPAAASAVTSRVDRVKQALAGLVTDGTLTQSQADKVATTLGSTDLGPGGPGGRHGRGGPDLAAAATALGLSEADLRTALEGGQSLAQVAKDKGVAVDTVVTALVTAEKAHIAQEVTDGHLTQAQADQRLADLTQRVTDRVNSVRPQHDGGPDGGSGPVPGAPAPSPTA